MWSRREILKVLAGAPVVLLLGGRSRGQEAEGDGSGLPTLWVATPAWGEGAEGQPRRDLALALHWLSTPEAPEDRLALANMRVVVAAPEALRAACPLIPHEERGAWWTNGAGTRLEPLPLDLLEAAHVEELRGWLRERALEDASLQSRAVAELGERDLVRFLEAPDDWAGAEPGAASWTLAALAAPVGTVWREKRVERVWPEDTRFAPEGTEWGRYISRGCGGSPYSNPDVTFRCGRGHVGEQRSYLRILSGEDGQ